MSASMDRADHDKIARRRHTAIWGTPLLSRAALVIACWAIMAVWVPTFRGQASVFAVLEFLPLLGLVALAVTIPLIAGEFDLSVGSMAALSGVVAVHAAANGLVVGLIAGVLVGCGIGAIQGLAIARLPVTSLAFTIGSLIVLRGVAYTLSDNAALPLPELTVTDPLFARIGVASVSAIIAAGAFLLIGAFLTWTRRGRSLYAIGGGRKEALTTGIPLDQTLLTAFALSGACAALAGALTTLKGGTADPASYEDVLLTAIAATLIGGVALTGGHGTIANTLLGTLLLAVIAAGLNFRGEPPATAAIVTGALLFLVVAVAAASAGLSRRGNHRWAQNASSNRSRPPLESDFGAA